MVSSCSSLLVSPWRLIAVISSINAARHGVRDLGNRQRLHWARRNIDAETYLSCSEISLEKVRLARLYVLPNIPGVFGVWYAGKVA